MTRSRKTLIATAIAQLGLISSGSVWAQAAAPSQPTKQDDTGQVVVTGQRAALQSAQKVKQDAEEVVDSIVADDIGKLPDRSVIEVLQRIVGATLDRAMTNDPQHFSVEGNSVAIRGLNYVRSEMNGRDSFSANGGRALNFEDVPPELLARVDVYKNPSAWQTEGGISGLVDLRTALPFDHKGFKGAISLDKSYSKLRGGKGSNSGSLLLSDRWVTGLGEFGLLVDFAKSNSSTRADQVKLDPLYPRTDLVPGKTVWVPKGAMWRSQDLDRERGGQYLALQWRPFAEMTNTLTVFKSDYTINWSERFMAMQHSTPFDVQVTNGVYDENGIFKSGTLSDPKNNGINQNPAHRIESRDSSTKDIAWKFEWKVTPRLTLRSDLQKIDAKTAGFASEIAIGLQLQKQTLDMTGAIPKLTFDASDLAQLTDANKHYWAYTMDHQDQSIAKSKAWKGDLEYALDDPIFHKIQVGVRLNDRHSSITNEVPSYNWQGVTLPWMLGWNIPKLAFLGDARFNSPGATSQYTFNNFFGGKITAPPGIYATDALLLNVKASYDQLHKYHDILCAEQKAAQGWGDCAQYGTPGYQRTVAFGTDPAGRNEVSEKAQALYTQLKFGFDDLKYPIDGNVGIRYVNTRAVADGFTVFSSNGTTFPPGVSVSGVPIPNIPNFAKAQSFENEYHNLLPSLNLRMKASNELQFRFAYSEAVSRPDFSQLQGYTNLGQSVKTKTDATTGAITVQSVNLTGGSDGNPMLKPVTAKQVDLTAEWYFAKAGSLTLAAFDKQLKGIVVSQSRGYAIPDINGTPQTFTVTSPVNGASGTARGFELAYQQYYDNLPDWLKGFGVQASYTHVESKRKLYNPVTSAYCSGDQGADNFNLWNNGCDTDGRTFGNLPLQGLSKHTINLAFMYEQGPLSARVAYNWRSQYLQAVQTSWATRNNDGKDTNPASANFGKTNLYYALPLWAKAYGQVDASVFYKVTRDLTLGAEVQNLTDAVFKQQMQQHVGMIDHAWISSGPRYSLQARYTF
jgi:iron complex outermembrane receptor protein